MAAWSVAVRDPRGWQVCGAVMEAERVGDIGVVREGRSVTLTLKGDTVTRGDLLQDFDEKTKLDLMRWPVGEPGADPVIKKV